MINSTAGKPDRGLDVLGLQIRHLIEDLLRRQSGQEEIEDVGYTDAHATNTGSPTALFRIEGDAVLPVCHSAKCGFRDNVAEACTPTDLFGCEGLNSRSWLA